MNDMHLIWLAFFLCGYIVGYAIRHIEARAERKRLYGDMEQQQEVRDRRIVWHQQHRNN